MLLFLTLGLAVVMAYQAWDATRSHERIAQGALHEHALSAAWQLTSAMERDLYGMYFGPGLEAVAKSGGAFADEPLRGDKDFQKILGDFGWTLAAEGLDFLFRLDLREGKLETRGKNRPDSDTVQWLQGLLKGEVSSGYSSVKGTPAGIRILDRGEGERVLVYIIEPDLGRFIVLWRTSRPLVENIFEFNQCVVGRMPRGWYRARKLGKDYFPGLGALVAGRREDAEEIAT
jgi:hypothetical protein